MYLCNKPNNIFFIRGGMIDAQYVILRAIELCNLLIQHTCFYFIILHISNAERGPGLELYCKNGGWGREVEQSQRSLQDVIRIDLS